MSLILYQLFGSFLPVVLPFNQKHWWEGKDGSGQIKSKTAKSAGKRGGCVLPPPELLRRHVTTSGVLIHDTRGSTYTTLITLSSYNGYNRHGSEFVL